MKPTYYGYIRVSSCDQNEERQKPRAADSRCFQAPCAFDLEIFGREQPS